MLLTKDDSGIIAYLKELENEGKNLKSDLFKICWYMRGGINYREAVKPHFLEGGQIQINHAN